MIDGTFDTKQESWINVNTRIFGSRFIDELKRVGENVRLKTDWSHEIMQMKKRNTNQKIPKRYNVSSGTLIYLYSHYCNKWPLTLETELKRTSNGHIN